MKRFVLVPSLLLALAAEPARAEEGAPRVTQRGVLPALPAPPRLELPKPSTQDLERVDALLTRLTSEALEERDAAARELLEVEPKLVAAIALRIAGIADSADKEAMKRAFTELRDRARDRVRDEQGGGSDVETPDYLALLIHDRPKPRSPARGAKTGDGGQATAYTNLVRVVALSRMLTQIGTVEAARALVEVYVRFGEFLRVHTQRELGALGDRSVAALIEARRHPAEKISSWARRELDRLGRAAPSEAVQIPNPNVLADVLRAYGRVKDPDAARIVVSLANSERAVIRDAAREAIVLFGEVGTWQLRESYENTVGKRPPRDWSWERMARELFAELDRLRSAAVAKVYEEGEAARARGDHEAMRRAFDLVLAKDPRFARREELAKAYFEDAKRTLTEQPRAAEESLARALRLSAEGSAERRAIESRLLTLQASRELERGVLDRTALTRALELDPENTDARRILDELSRAAPDQTSSRARLLAAGSLAVGALLAVLVLLGKRPWKSRETSDPSDN